MVADGEGGKTTNMAARKTVKLGGFSWERFVLFKQTGSIDKIAVSVQWTSQRKNLEILGMKSYEVYFVPYVIAMQTEGRVFG